MLHMPHDSSVSDALVLGSTFDSLSDYLCRRKGLEEVYANDRKRRRLVYALRRRHSDRRAPDLAIMTPKTCIRALGHVAKKSRTLPGLLGGMLQCMADLSVTG
jgi:hypothetical protein